VVKVDGSSTVYPITEAVAEEFQKARKGAVNVTVGISGTGGGFKKFCRGETDIANASRPISKGNGGVRQGRYPLLRNAHRL
jgi:phosphate transport system substrate-binding protein